MRENADVVGNDLPGSVEMWIYIPWVGPDSKFKVHQDEVIPFNGELPLIRQLTPSEDYKQVNGTTPAISRILNKLGVSFSQFSVLSIIGMRVSVHWTKGSPGWWPGTVVDYEPKLGKHWIRYDVEDANGDRHFPQDLLFAHKNWKFCN